MFNLKYRGYLSPTIPERIARYSRFKQSVVATGCRKRVLLRTSSVRLLSRLPSLQDSHSSCPCRHLQVPNPSRPLRNHPPLFHLDHLHRQMLRQPPSSLHSGQRTAKMLEQHQDQHIMPLRHSRLDPQPHRTSGQRVQFNMLHLPPHLTPIRHHTLNSRVAISPKRNTNLNRTPSPPLLRSAIPLHLRPRTIPARAMVEHHL